MRKIVFFILSVISFSGFANSHFEFNNQNINALIGLICTGEENIATMATGGGIEDERISVSKWQIKNLGDQIVVQGFCNAAYMKDNYDFRLENALDLYITFYPNEIKNSSKSVVKGTLGNADLEIGFSSSLDIVNGDIEIKVEVTYLAIAPGLAGARANGFESLIDNLLPDLFNISSKNSTMSFCNHGTSGCKNLSWKSSKSEKLKYKAIGTGWLMNFVVEKVGTHLFLNAAKIINMGSLTRTPNLYCEKDTGCGGAVVLNSSSSSISACSLYRENTSWDMNEKICRKVLNSLQI